MRIKKGESVVLPAAANHRFLMVVDCLTAPVTVTKDGNILIQITLAENDGVCAALVFSDGKKIVLRGENAKGREIILTQGDAHVVLYVDGILMDEDFFFAPIHYADATLFAGSFSHFEAGYLYHSMWESAVGGMAFPSLDALAPLGHGNVITDCFAAAVGERTQLFYFVKSGGNEKCGKGALRLFDAEITADGRLVSLPIALPIDEISEKGVKDATLLWHEGRGYLYYLMEKDGGTVLSCAVSEDGYSFLKTGLDVEIADVENETVTSLTACGGQTPRLYFVAKGKSYFAESIDLLHFSAPVSLSVVTDHGAEKVMPVVSARGTSLFFRKESLLYRLTENGAEKVLSEKDCYPLLEGDKLYLYSVAKGKIMRQLLP